MVTNNKRRSGHRHESRERKHKASLPSLSDWPYLGLLWLGRIVLLATVTAAPWYYGSATWGSQFWLVQASWLVLSLALLSVIVRPASAMKVSPIALGLAGLIVIGCIQALPLPNFVTAFVGSTSTFQREVSGIAARWDSDANSSLPEPASKSASQPVRTYISIDPTQTSASIAAMTTALVFLVASTQFFATRSSIIVLLFTIVVGACAHSFVGLIQALSWNHEPFLKMPHPSHFSTFVSRNSAPQYYATAIGSAFALLGISLREQRRKNLGHHNIRYPAVNVFSRIRRRLDDVLVELNAISVTAIVTLLVLMLSVIAAASRGGALSNLFACLITGFVVLGSRNGAFKVLTAVTLLGAAVVLIMTSLDLDDQLMSRFELLDEVAFQGEEGRLLVWRLSLNSLSWYWMLGSGIGTYHFGILPFHNEPPNIWYYHAENIPIEVLCETGFIGFAIVCFVVARLFLDLRGEHARRKHRNVLLVAVVFAVCAIGLHSLVDFSLILPGVYLPFVAVLGAFLGERHRIALERKRHSDDAKDGLEAAKQHPSTRPKNSAVDEAASVTTNLIQNKPATGRSAAPGYAAIVLVVAFACWIGFSNLGGYAASESLSTMLNDVKAASELRDSSKAKLDEPNASLEYIAGYAEGVLNWYPEHPEAHLQVARVRQFLWQRNVSQNWKWEDVSEAERKTWSNPRLVASAFRGPDEQGYTELRKLAASDKEGMRIARQIFDGFRLASELSPLDWRAATGMFHSDFGWQKPNELLQNAASVFVLAGKRKDFSLDVGQLLLREKKNTAALEILRELFQSQPSLLSQRTLSLIVNYVSPQELLNIVSSDVAVQAQLCELLAATPKWLEFRPEMTKALQSRYREATATTLEGWLSLAWLAKVEGDKKSEEAFLKKAADQNPNRHDVRFRLASFLADEGRLKESIEQVNKCINQAADTSHYESFLQKVKQRLDQSRQ